MHVLKLMLFWIQNAKDDFIEYKCLCYNKNYQKDVWWKFNEDICQYI